MDDVSPTNRRRFWNPRFGIHRATYNVQQTSLSNERRNSVDDSESEVADDEDEEDGRDQRDDGRATVQGRCTRCFMCVVLILVSLIVGGIMLYVVVLSVKDKANASIIAEMNTTMTTVITTSLEITTDLGGKHTCISGEFWCGSLDDLTECLPGEWRCDGEADCSTGTDEEDCNVPSVNTTPEQSQPCVAWRQTFNQSCVAENPSTDCVYIPGCQAGGILWAEVQCTTDILSCWCVDTINGRTVTGTFVGLDVLDGEPLPHCSA